MGTGHAGWFSFQPLYQQVTRDNPDLFELTGTLLDVNRPVTISVIGRLRIHDINFSCVRLALPRRQ
jgi:hypothetical protein